MSRARHHRRCCHRSVDDEAGPRRYPSPPHTRRAGNHLARVDPACSMSRASSHAGHSVETGARRPDPWWRHRAPLTAFGLAADNLVEAELVTADGRILGGGGQDADDSDLSGPFAAAGRQFSGWLPISCCGRIRRRPCSGDSSGTASPTLRRSLPHSAVALSPLPDELGVVCALVHAPDDSGTKLAALPICHSGDDEQRAESEVKELRGIAAPAFDLLERMPYPMMNTLLDGAFPVWRVELLEVDLSRGPSGRGDRGAGCSVRTSSVADERPRK